MKRRAFRKFYGKSLGTFQIQVMRVNFRKLWKVLIFHEFSWYLQFLEGFSTIIWRIIIIPPTHGIYSNIVGLVVIQFTFVASI